MFSADRRRYLQPLSPPPRVRSRTGLAAGVFSIALCAISTTQARTLEDAQSLHRAGKLDEALEAYREFADRVKESDPLRAGSARNNACVILMNTGDLVAAREECSEALRLRRISGDDRRLSRALNNLGLVEQYLTEFHAAERHFREALELNLARGDAESQAINLANLGVLATQAGWFSKALGFYQRVLDTAREHADTAWAGKQTRLARINQAVVFEKLGAYREALELYKLADTERAEMDSWTRAGLAVNLGVAFRNLGDPVRALGAFEAARETYDGLGGRSALSNVYLNLGIVYHLNLARPQEAESAYREALRLAVESGDRSEEIRDRCYLGRFLLDRGRVDEAEETFRRSLEASLESGSAEGRWTSLEGLARVSVSRGEPEAAIDGLREAMDEIERTRGTLEQSSLRGGFFGEKRPVYSLAVEVLHELGLAEQAFEVAQRAKARMLLDELGPDSARPAPLDAAGIVTRVGDDLLLEYFVAENELFVWTVGSGRLEMHALGAPDEVLASVERVHRRLSWGEAPDESALRELSRILLPEEVRRNGSIGQLRISPDGRLHYLPFEILPLPDRDGMRLIESADVSYLPSGSALGWLSGCRSRADLTVVGFGSPALSSASSAGPGPAELIASRFDLDSLPAAAEELEGIERWLPGRHEIRIGDAATEEAFRELVSRGPRVVHLASHAIIDERHGRGAAIVLSPGGKSDGLLHPDEIAALDFPVDLTVLAACRTALGSHDDGRALATLTGSFLAAGSSAVVATLWDVGDQATSAFMEQFYYQLRRGHAPAGALRRAKQRFVADERWRDRHDWAAYVLIGEAGGIVSSSRIGAWILVPVGIVLLLLAYRLRAPRSRPAR